MDHLILLAVLKSLALLLLVDSAEDVVLLEVFTSVFLNKLVLEVLLLLLVCLLNLPELLLLLDDLLLLETFFVFKDLNHFLSLLGLLLHPLLLSHQTLLISVLDFLGLLLDSPLE